MSIQLASHSPLLEKRDVRSGRSGKVLLPPGLHGGRMRELVSILPQGMPAKRLVCCRGAAEALGRARGVVVKRGKVGAFAMPGAAIA